MFICYCHISLQCSSGLSESASNRPAVQLPWDERSRWRLERHAWTSAGKLRFNHIISAFKKYICSLRLLTFSKQSAHSPGLMACMCFRVKQHFPIALQPVQYWCGFISYKSQWVRNLHIPRQNTDPQWLLSAILYQPLQALNDLLTASFLHCVVIKRLAMWHRSYPMHSANFSQIQNPMDMMTCHCCMLMRVSFWSDLVFSLCGISN